MRMFLIVSGVCFVAFVNVVLYCCLRVASMADQRMEKLISEKNTKKND